MHNSSGAFILFMILRSCRGQHLQNKENVSMSEQRTVNGWHEVCGDRLAIGNNYGNVVVMCRAEYDKFRGFQLLVGEQDNDLSKITVIRPVSKETAQ